MFVRGQLFMSTDLQGRWQFMIVGGLLQQLLRHFIQNLKSKILPLYLDKVSEDSFLTYKADN